MVSESMTEVRRYANFGNEVYDMMPTYFKVKCNSIKMLEARGYAIPAEEIAYLPSGLAQCISSSDYFSNYQEYKAKMEYFSNYYRSMQDSNHRSFAMNMSQVYVHKDGHHRYVTFIEAATKGKKVLTDDLTLAIAIINRSAGGPQGLVNSKVTFVVPTSIKAVDISSMDIAHLDYEIFTHDYLIVDAVNHSFSSTYRLLTNEEASEFYGRNKILPSQLPIFTSNDPIVRYYGWKAGDLILIGRMNASTEGSVTVSTYYRLVSPHIYERK